MTNQLPPSRTMLATQSYDNTLRTLKLIKSAIEAGAIISNRIVDLSVETPEARTLEDIVEEAIGVAEGKS